MKTKKIPHLNSKRFILINDDFLTTGQSFRAGLHRWEIVFIGIDACCLAKNFFGKTKVFTGSVKV